MHYASKTESKCINLSLGDNLESRIRIGELARQTMLLLNKLLHECMRCYSKWVRRSSRYHTEKASWTCGARHEYRSSQMNRKGSFSDTVLLQNVTVLTAGTIIIKRIRLYFLGYNCGDECGPSPIKSYI